MKVLCILYDDPKGGMPKSVLYVKKVNIPIVIIENNPAINEFFKLPIPLI